MVAFTTPDQREKKEEGVDNREARGPTNDRSKYFEGRIRSLIAPSTTACHSPKDREISPSIQHSPCPPSDLQKKQEAHMPKKDREIVLRFLLSGVEEPSVTQRLEQELSVMQECYKPEAHLII